MSIKKVFAFTALIVIIAILFPQVQNASAAPDKAEIGGFLLPFSDIDQFKLGDLGYFEPPTHARIEAYDFIQKNQTIDIPLLAPKSGVVLEVRDSLAHISYIVDNGSCF